MASSLAEALPQASFSESHSLDIDGTPEQVWSALTRLRWSDLSLTTPLVWARRLGRRPGVGERRVLEQGPVPLMRTEPPTYAAGVAIGQPWRLRPERGPGLDDLADVREFTAPRWLKYGWDFALAAVAPGKTRITTTTLCEPTDDLARRRFSAYWALIRPFSGLIRRDILHSIARLVREGEVEVEAEVEDVAPGQRTLIGPSPRFGLPRYLRARFTVPEDPRIEVSGLVDEPFALTRSDLGSLPEVTLELDLHCVMTWSERGIEWTGWRFVDLWQDLVKSRANPKTVEILIHGLDGARSSIPLVELLRTDVLIAHSRTGELLDIDHGAPYRLLIPQLYGYQNVKHVCRMELLDQRVRGPHEPWIMHRRGRVDLEERNGLGLKRTVRGVNGLFARRALRSSGAHDPRFRRAPQQPAGEES